MDRVVVVVASYRGVGQPTQACLRALERHGAHVITTTGIPDVALARNDVLTLALGRKRNADVFLLADDDMVWPLEAAAKLVGLARSTGEPWSAAYATADGSLAATPLDWHAERTDGLRMVGLGFCAIPVARLEALAKRLGTVIGPQGKQLVPFCQCSVVTPEHDGRPRWCSEDYWLCRSLGGVRLAPYVAAGHLKEVPLWPDDATLTRLAEGTALPPSEPPSEPPTKPDAPRPPKPPKPAKRSSKPAKRPRRRKAQANGATQTTP